MIEILVYREKWYTCKYNLHSKERHVLVHFSAVRALYSNRIATNARSRVREPGTEAFAGNGSYRPNTQYLVYLLLLNFAPKNP